MQYYQSVTYSMYSNGLTVSVYQGEKPMMQEQLDRVVELIEPWFMFSLVWTVGGTVDADGRKKFSEWLHKKMKKEEVILWQFVSVNIWRC